MLALHGLFAARKGDGGGALYCDIGVSHADVMWQAMAAARGRRVVAWDEAWELLGSALPPSTIVQQWRWGDDHINTTRAITSAGYSACVYISLYLHI